MNDSLRGAVEERCAETRHFAPLFDYDHLPAELQPVSAVCHDLAVTMVTSLPDGFELWEGLRKLLEAKDCFVRARKLDEQ